MNNDQRRDPRDGPWAAEPDPKKLAQEIFRHLDIENVLIGTPIRSIQARAYQMFFGAIDHGNDDALSSLITRGGSSGEIVKIKINSLRTNALAQHQIVTNPELTWEVTAANGDARSLADAQSGQDILEWIWKQHDVKRFVIDAVLWAIVLGEHFLHLTWDESLGEPVQAHPEDGRPVPAGDIKISAIPSWDVFRDPKARSYEDSRWVCLREQVDRHDLASTYPLFDDQILELSQGTNTSSDEKLWVYTFYHRKARSIPGGRKVILISEDIVLADQPLGPADDPCPLIRMTAADLYETPWPYTNFWEDMARQGLFDDVQTSLATNIVAFGRQLLLVEEGSEMDIDTLADGPAVIKIRKGSAPPTALQLTASPAEAFTHIERLRAEGRNTFGLNDVSMGQPQGTALNAQAFALLASMAIQQNSDLQKRYVQFVSLVGRVILKVFQANATMPRKLSISGKNGLRASSRKEFDSSDLLGLDDVSVSIGAPLSQTIAGRVQIADMYTQKGFITVPEQLQTVLETGRLEPLTDVLRQELLYISEENEQLLSGEQPPVKITDSHQMHIREHRGPTFSSTSRIDPAINEACDHHIAEHINFLTNTDPTLLIAMGQTPPAPTIASAPSTTTGPSLPPPPTPGAAETSVDLPEPPPNPMTGGPIVPK